MRRPCLLVIVYLTSGQVRLYIIYCNLHNYNCNYMNSVFLMHILDPEAELQMTWCLFRNISTSSLPLWLHASHYVANTETHFSHKIIIKSTNPTKIQSLRNPWIRHRAVTCRMKCHWLRVSSRPSPPNSLMSAELRTRISADTWIVPLRRTVTR